MPVARRGSVGASVSRPWRSGVATLGIVAVAAGCQVDSPVGVAPAQVRTTSRSLASSAIAGRYIVTLRPDIQDPAGTTESLLKSSNATKALKYGKALRGFSGVMSADAAARLAANPLVASVEPDQLVIAHDVQTPAPWALDRVDQRALPLNNAFVYSNTGAGVNVYVFDTGIRLTHTQFGGRASSVFSVFTDGLDATDCNEHGTFVAGIVGSTVYGVAKAATLRSVRVLDCAGTGTASNMIAGLDWLAANRVLPAVANLSLGLPQSAAVNQAVNNVIASGVTVVVSAGNEGVDACLYSPASASAAITVGGTTAGDAMASWSNRGSCVDLFAPGHTVYSTGNSSDVAVNNLTGSSGAAAHVSGAAAVYLSTNPSASPATVASALIGNATTGVISAMDAASPNRLLYVGDGSAPPPPPPPSSTDKAPTAALTSSCKKITCTFDASKSTDDKGIVSYDWTFGDGTSSRTTTSKTSKTYAVAKDYTVTVKVTDASGQSSSASILIRLKGR